MPRERRDCRRRRRDLVRDVPGSRALGGGGGSFTAELDVRRASPYALFAEVTPTDGPAATGQVLRSTVWAAGTEPCFAHLEASAAFDGRMAHRATLQDTRITISPLEAPL